MKLLLAIFTAAMLAISAAVPAVAAESNEMIAAPTTADAPSGHKAKKVKKAKKVTKHKARKLNKTHH